MTSDREAEIQQEIDAALARLRVQEFALLEVLQTLSSPHAAAVANGLRARVNAWALEAGHLLTPTVDETATEQLTSLLGALDEAPTMPARLLLEVPDRSSP